MTARDDLLAALRDGNIWGDPGRGEELADAYELDIRRQVAAELHDIADDGTCGCGCHCAPFIDPDAPCPSCKDKGGSRLGAACYLCGVVRSVPPEPPGPSLVPPQIYAGLMAQVLGTQLRQPRPTDGWTSVRGIPVPNEILEDRQWTPGVIAWLASQLAWRPKPVFTGVLAYLADGDQ